VDERAKEHNQRVLAQMRMQREGIAMTQCSRLEAMMDPSNPNVFEQNDNQPKTEPSFSVEADSGAQDGGGTSPAPTNDNL
jgi:hypothetical protein